MKYWASKHFEKVISCEPSKTLFEKANIKFKNINNCFLSNEISITFLKKNLATIQDKKNIIFWLDAHYKGGEYLW